LALYPNVLRLETYSATFTESVKAIIRPIGEDSGVIERVAKRACEYDQKYIVICRAFMRSMMELANFER
jgi:hypothetical protein